MKILQIAPAWIHTPPKAYGGTEWVISNLTEGLVDLGHQVTIFATGKSKSAGDLDYFFKKSFSEMDIPWNASLPAIIHFHQAVKNAQDYDLIHAHLSSGSDLAILPFLADLTDQGVPNIVTVHGHWPYDRFSFMDKMFLKTYAHNITAVCISKSMQKHLPKEFRYGGFVHNSLKLSAYKYKANKGNYLTWLGRIFPEKGTREAIMAAKIAGEQLIFAGNIDRYEPISIEYFENKVKPLIDGSQIIYLGEADLKMKNQMLGGAKALINPIDWEEPFGMVMVESMACGTPVISFNRGAASELVVNGKTGFLVNNLKEMVKAINLIPTLNSIDSRKHVESNFTPISAGSKYLNLYEKEIKKRSKLFKTPGFKLYKGVFSSNFQD